VSRANESWELEEELWRRLYEKQVAGLSPGPCRRGGAMVKLDGTPGRHGTGISLQINLSLLQTLATANLYYVSG
jgi:hypothetical protein